MVVRSLIRDQSHRLGDLGIHHAVVCSLLMLWLVGLEVNKVWGSCRWTPCLGRVVTVRVGTGRAWMRLNGFPTVAFRERPELGVGIGIVCG